MATVTKDFRIKSGLVVEGTNATVNGSDLITEDAITGGTQTNIAVTYNPSTKVVDFSVDALSIDTAGPLSYTNEVLDLVTSDGLAIDTANNGLKVALYEDAGIAASGLEFNAGSLKVDAGAGLTIDGSGKLKVSTGDGIELTQSGQVQAKLSPTSGLQIDTASNNGLKVNVGTGLEISLDSVQLADANSNVGTFGSSTSVPSITVDAKGRVTAVSTNDIATSLSIATDVGSDTISLLTDTLTISGGEGIDVAMANNAITISAEDATTTNKGVASFDTDNFTVTSGAVSAKAATIGTSTVELGSTTSTLEGLTSISVGTTVVTSGKIENTTAAGDLILDTAGGSIDVSSNKITNLATPTNPSDAATKGYVDGVAAGLNWKPAVNLLANTNINLTTPVSWPATPGIDGHAEPTEPYRVLLTNQTIDSENGIWVYTPGVTPFEPTWTRAADADAYTELEGAAVFVMEGNQYASTSWVQSNHYLSDFTNQEWDQFSGQGTYAAGNGLSLVGNEFSINDTVVVTHTDLEGYLNSTVGSEGTTILYVQDYVETAIETGDPTATPTYLALDINSVAKQVAASATTDGAGTDYVVYEFLCSNEYGNTEYYRSAKFLVKMASGTHTQVSEILLTLDSSNNLAITEYAIVGTNGNLGNVSASVFGAQSSFPDKIQLTVNSASVLNVKVAGTLLV